jgi:hypothetical protein
MVTQTHLSKPSQMHHGRVGTRAGTLSVQRDGKYASHQLVLLCGKLHVRFVGCNTASPFLRCEALIYTARVSCPTISYKLMNGYLMRFAGTDEELHILHSGGLAAGLQRQPLWRRKGQLGGSRDLGQEYL